MKKILLPALIATLMLSACNKAAENPTEPKADTPIAAPQTNNTPTPPEQHAHDHAHDDKHSHHHEGDKYQCGDQTIHIVVHDHDGEIEAHLTSDNVTYDLNEDVQTKGRFTTDDGIFGEDKGMALILDGDNAKVTTLDDKVVLDCKKANP